VDVVTGPVGAQGLEWPPLRRYLEERLAYGRRLLSGLQHPGHLEVGNVGYVALLEELREVVERHHPDPGYSDQFCAACVDVDAEWPCWRAVWVARWFAHRADFDAHWLPPDPASRTEALLALEHCRTAGGIVFAPDDAATMGLMSWLCGARPDSAIRLASSPKLNGVPVRTAPSVFRGHFCASGEPSSRWAVDEAHGVQPRFSGVVLPDDVQLRSSGVVLLDDDDGPAGDR
jgi:hypothetical protein